jgi:hypothetical protein
MNNNQLQLAIKLSEYSFITRYKQNIYMRIIERSDIIKTMIVWSW